MVAPPSSSKASPTLKTNHNLLMVIDQNVQIAKYGNKTVMLNFTVYYEHGKIFCEE